MKRPTYLVHRPAPSPFPQTTPATQQVPADVARLVVAAREAVFEDPSPERTAELNAASEAFADRVPWDDEPEDAAELRADTPPATQQSAVGEPDRYDAGLLGDGGGGDVGWWQDYIRAELERAYEFYSNQFASLHTPPPVATATVVDAGGQ